jgi:hypothetical protein
MAFGGDDSLEWFGRFGDVPGVAYATPSSVNRSRLKGANSKPTIVRYDGIPPSLTWGSGSASPAHERAFKDMRGLKTSDLLKNLNEALELPGQILDYHFALQSTLEQLWSRRHDEPGMAEEIERIGWLDIKLVLAHSDEFSVRDEGRYVRILAFGNLRLLYEREGALREALQVAEFEAKFADNDKILADLRMRSAAEAEV